MGYMVLFIFSLLPLVTTAAVGDRWTRALGRSAREGCKWEAAKLAADAVADSFVTPEGTYSAWVVLKFYDNPHQTRFVDGKSLPLTGEMVFADMKRVWLQGGETYLNIPHEERLGDGAFKGNRYVLYLVRVDSNDRDSFSVLLASHHTLAIEKTRDELQAKLRIHQSIPDEL